MKESLIYLGGAMVAMVLGLMANAWRIKKLEEVVGQIAIHTSAALTLLAQDVAVLKSHEIVTKKTLDK